MGKSRAAKRARRHRQRKRSSVDDGMTDATRQFADAIHGLVDPQPHPQTIHTLPCRYTTLRAALYTHRGGNGNHHRAHTIPTYIDALKYCLEIDTLAHQLHQQFPAHYCRIVDRDAHPTIRALREVLTHRFTGADVLEQIKSATQRLAGYAQKIDDLFGTKPVFLPNPCPSCGHTHAHKLNDEGVTVRTPALAVSVEHGAVCQQCHQTWRPDQLQFLGLVLGYRPLPGVVPTKITCL